MGIELDSVLTQNKSNRNYDFIHSTENLVVCNTYLSHLTSFIPNLLDIIVLYG
jgi:hypothetical protein